MLALLLEKPGEVVTREELRERLWSGDTFAVSPDGQRMAIALEEESRHLVMIDGLRGVGR